MKPTAVTLWAALVVPVNQDIPAMDLPVPVSLLKQAGMLTLALLACNSIS